MNKKEKVVELEVFFDRAKGKAYSGKLLGMLSEEEFAALSKSKSLQNELSALDCKPLSHIAEANVNGLRLAMTVTKEDGKKIDIPTLFVTGPMDMINSVVNANNLNFVSNDGTFFIAAEKEV